MEKEKKEKCIFCVDGVCECWEKDTDPKCDGINPPKDCPAKD